MALDQSVSILFQWDDSLMSVEDFFYHMHCLELQNFILEVYVLLNVKQHLLK